MGNEHIRLVKPAMQLKNAYLAFYEEWKESGETMIPWVIERDPRDFEAMIQFLENNEKGVGLPEGWVPDSTYWLIDGKDRVLGVVNIRHDLTDFLRNAGGHIGYGIRPSERQKGYATELLKLSLQKCRELGIEQALVVCDDVNTASRKTILNNGGIEDTDFIEEDGTIVKRYWVPVNTKV